MLRIKLVKSVIGQEKRNRLTVVALGLRKTQQTVEHKDTPSVRGMIHKVKHLLQVEEVEDAPVADAKPPKAAKAADAEPKPEKAPRAKKAKSEDASPETEPAMAGDKE